MPDSNELLSSDSPLIHPNQDELEYSAFAQYVAKAVVTMVPSNGLVMSLNGSWGYGKTTALNFIIHYLQQYDPAQKPIIVKFNPWWFSDREDLTRLLISQINTSLGKKEYKEIKKKIADFAELISKIPGIPGLEAGSFLADRLRKQSEISSLKIAIGNLLLAKNKKIIVIIDDIDRLSADEIRELFRTIKAVADFPNTIYLLAFDNKVVINALEKDFTASGSDYLEKIVQVPFSLPIPDKISLQRLLFSKLDHILVGTPSELFDKAYWTNVYYDGIDDLISSPRDVTRLFNALRTTYPALVGEVNPVDLIAIEAIRVFLPQFYEIIREHSELLSGSSPIGQNAQVKTERKSTFERWLDLVTEKDRNALKKLMSRLFPLFSQAFGGTTYSGEFLKTWEKQLRVCSPGHFPIYFRFSISSEEISNAEMKTFLATSSDPNAFGEALIEFSKKHRRDGSSRLRMILEKLEAYTQDIPLEQIPGIVGSFFDVGDNLLIKEDEPKEFFSMGNDMRVARLIYQLISRVTQDQRFAILKEAIESGRGVSVTEDYVAILGQEHGKFGGEIQHLEADREVNSGQLQELEALALKKIRDAAENGKLIDVPILRGILPQWNDWSGNDTEVREWVSKVTVTDENLAKFIYCFENVQRSQTIGEYALREKYRVDPEWVQKYINPDDIYLRVKTLIGNINIPENYQKAASQFVKEYEMRKQGIDPNQRF